jgi:hypothetical protein
MFQHFAEVLVMLKGYFFVTKADITAITKRQFRLCCKLNNMKKGLLMLCICNIAMISVAQNQNSNWYFGIGPAFETTWSVTDNITGDTDNFRTGVTEKVGLKTVVHANFNRLGLEWYGMVKTNSTKMVLEPTPADLAYHVDFKSSAHQSGVALETGLYAGGNFQLGRHELYTGLGMGVAYTRFNGFGGRARSAPQSNYQPDTVPYFQYGNYDDNLISINTVTPLASAVVSFRQKFKNNRLGMVYSIENKWGLTPTMNESFVYDLTVGNSQSSARYTATFTDIRFIHLTASILFSFDIGGKKREKG